MSSFRVLTFLSLCVALAGCEAVRLPTEPTTTAPVTSGPGQPADSSGVQNTKQNYDLTGSWTWEETVRSAIPPFIAEMIPIVPEGEITYLSCTGGGQLQLVQTGETVTGTATQAGACFTDGGQGPFWPPSFPPQLVVTAGTVSGKDLSFRFNNCHYTAKIVGSGDKLMGEGECDLPLPAPYFLRTPVFRAQR
jgi:hypothetical protein